MAPARVRRIRLTDSPVTPHATRAPKWPYGWQTSCGPCMDVWTWMHWETALAFAIDHMYHGEHPS